ncbi:hypothetical protein LTR56_008074 [Elasticomyces elasticus]|nr:hypothetical protein LTR56_008074 [Elasticomyces elasticus]KAK3665829.1 hypothetical protein LTR22_003460 [Elasticomyces elasticus]KAK4926253.1 hypothetical protein LTR49_006725 [Elasticomyces elasticus]KAK5762011.1 hypothetical protein LTS12_007883 [Elasticomyces elasticus]
MASPVTFTTILYDASKALIEGSLVAGGFGLYGRLSKLLLPPRASTEQNRKAVALDKFLYMDPIAQFYQTTDGWKVLRMVLMAIHIGNCLVEGFGGMHSLDAVMSLSSFMIGLVLFQRAWQWTALPAGQRNEDIKTAARAVGRYLRSGRAAIEAVPAAARTAISAVISAAKHELETPHAAPTVDVATPTMKASEDVATEGRSDEAASTSTEDVNIDALRNSVMRALSVAASLGIPVDGTCDRLENEWIAPYATRGVR